MKALDVTYFWRRKAPFERLKYELLVGSGGMLPQEIFKKNTQKRSFKRFWKSSTSFLGKARVHSNSL